MSKTDAAYMRDYRARKKLAKMIADQTPEQALAEARSYVSEYVALYNDTARERDALREEVRHLKEELAKRPTRAEYNAERKASARRLDEQFNSRPFTPVPKKGK